MGIVEQIQQQQGSICERWTGYCRYNAANDACNSYKHCNQVYENLKKEILHEKVFKKIKYSMFGRKIKVIYYRFYYAFLYKDSG